MKFTNLICLSVILIVSAACGPTVSPTPIIATPSPTARPVATATTAKSLRQFQMIDLKQGWGAGDRQVLRTTDGGASWIDVTPKDIKLEISMVPQVIGVDARTAWVIEPNLADMNAGRLFRTGDAGQTWQVSAVPFGFVYAQVLDSLHAFFLASRGVAAGSNVVDLYRTDDGGATWTQLARSSPDQQAEGSLPFGGLKSGAVFRDASHGWVTGFIPMDGATYIYQTADAGKTWKPVQLKLPAILSKTQVEVQPPRFFDGQTGVMVTRLSGDPAAQVFYLTQDGGATWNAAPLITFTGLVSVISMTDWVVWDGRNLHATHDSGQTWQQISPNINLEQKINDMQFLTPQNGWALSMENGDVTHLYRTEDAGQTWK